MPVFMERDAFKAILYGALSCRCPVTRETEVRLFHEYFQWIDPQARSFAPIWDIVNQNPSRTPIHNLLEMASYGHDDPDDFTITVGDAIRVLGSKFHFNNLVRGLDPLVVKDVPSFLVSHMLVPARLSQETDSVRAVFSFDGKEILFDPVFFPPDIVWYDNSLYGVHMGTVICPLTKNRAAGLGRHLAMIPEFPMLCSRVSRVDFKDFQYYGNYHNQVRERFRIHFGS